MPVSLSGLIHHSHYYYYYKLLAEMMHNINNDCVPPNLKDLFLPTKKVHSYNKESSVSDNIYTKIKAGDKKTIFLLSRCEALE